MTDKIERINPLKKSTQPASAGETAFNAETALSRQELGSLKLTPVVVGELGKRDVEALADLEHRIVVPAHK